MRVYDAQNPETVEDSATVTVVIKPTKVEKENCLWCWLIPLIVVVLLGVGVAIWFLMKSDKMENFIGQDISAVEIAADEAGYVIQQPLKAVISEEAPGTIVDQLPKPGEELSEEGKVELHLTVSAATVEVPKLVGQSLADAEVALQSLNLKLGKVVEDTNSSGNTGPVLIIGQTPDANTRVLPEAKIDLVIPSTFRDVPPVIGFKFGEAKNALEELGFRVNMQLVSTGQANQGLIVGQNPLPNTRKKIGSTITVKVEKTKIAVPNVVGKTPADAIKILKKKGFKVKTRYKGRAVLSKKIKVKDQSPKNQKADLGSTVTITYPRYGLTTGTGTIIQPIMIQAIAVASGNASIKQTWRADLDTNNAPSNNGADIWFQAKTSTDRYVTPVNGSKIANVGTKATSLAACKKARLLENPVHLKSLKVGSYLCVKTNKGQYSAVKITSIPSASEELGIQFSTWK